MKSIKVIDTYMYEIMKRENCATILLYLKNRCGQTAFVAVFKKAST